MKDTPRGMLRHIAIFGKTNAGKSTLFNLLTGQENAIVSEKAGTTTDPVVKNMELLPFGPVVLIDTAGLDDASELGGQRVKKTRAFARRADIGIFLKEIGEAGDFPADSFFTGEKIQAFTKCDLADSQTLEAAKKRHPDALFISKGNKGDIESFKKTLVEKLAGMGGIEEDSLVGDLVPPGGRVVMVVPVDSGAPKGRLILPQVQFLRDCLDHGIKTYVTRDSELEGALADIGRIDLVVTDSQIFAFVDKTVPANIPLTSFSMLLARQNGDLRQLIDGLGVITSLQDGDKILMLETCTHNHSHEDIGKVKIPRLLEKFCGKKLEYDFYSGYDMPDDLTGYALAILCGGCMVSKREMLSRLRLLKESGIPATNYGVVLAYLNGILDRSKIIFEQGGAL
ncbi:MAG: [FeFe] hydrogenase H-cluster maturation GTPase HydF [Spirochaetes bacterium]|nr:[FeFe] hydrogenase H-cluster maturation GTPase HydF [Spirochaetota bacterium]